MEKRVIPGTNLEVSVVCLGTMTFGSPVEEAEAIKIIHWSMEHNINFIDTANMYEGYARFAGSSGGVAEMILGKALLGRRNQVILATKLGMKVGETPVDEGTSPAAIRKHLDKSLQRLRTDYVDLYYLHKPDPSVSLSEILGTLDEAKQKGKIRFYGISNYSAEQTRELLHVADRLHLPRPAVHQPAYSLIKRDNEADLFPLCQREKIGVIPYQILQGGLLTGKYRRDQAIPIDSRKAEKSTWLPAFNDELFDKLESIESEARAKKRTLMEHAIKEVLDNPAVVSVVMGVKSIPQLQTVVDYLK